MSSSSRSGTSRIISDAQIIELVYKLQQLVPELHRPRSDKVSASKVLHETCTYIRNLKREMEDLSDRLSQLLTTLDSNSEEARIIASLVN
ncbi:transcription factor PRE6-like [Silene latifolia]|uniref:transcription factor PRE6-like n=1 Tax=Silene latifolia TaxID=37657 RepID=UPI003D787096